MIIDDEIITATQVGELQDRVKERIQGGWSPSGGIALLHDEEVGDSKPHMVFAQAIVLKKVQNGN